MMKLWTLWGGALRRIRVKVKMWRFKTQNKMEKINVEIELLVLTRLNCVVKHTSLFLCVQDPHWKFLSWLANCTVSSQGLARWLGLLQWKAIHFDFCDFSHESEFTNNSCSWWKEMLVSYGIWLVVSVIAFGGLCMLAMRQILCNPGQSLPSN